VSLRQLKEGDHMVELLWEDNGVDDTGVYGRHKPVFQREEIRGVRGLSAVGTELE
jgi:hypothetical protein